jgi:hypothetical protein
MSVFDKIRIGFSASNKEQYGGADAAASDRQGVATNLNNNGKALSGAAGVALGVLGTLAAPALLPREEGLIKVLPEMGALSMDQLAGIGINKIGTEGFVNLVTIESVPEGSQLSFEIKSPGQDQGTNVVHVIPDINDEMHRFLLKFLKEHEGKRKYCSAQGYITQRGSNPVLDATTLTFSPEDQPYKPDQAQKPVNHKPWSREDITSFGALFTKDPKK